MIKVLFVCLGNICRSSAAQGVFEQIIKERGLESSFSVDSAGLIDYHKGELSDPRMIRHAHNRGYELTHRSRPIAMSDFEEFDYIYAMDLQNVQGLRRLNPQIAEQKVSLLGKLCTRHNVEIIPDPYYGSGKDFEYVLDLLEDSCNNLCDMLVEKFNLV